MLRILLALLLALLLLSTTPAQVPQPVTSPWGSWVEADFPFFSSVVDARRAGTGFPAGNLTPRGLVLKIGSGHWAAFDVDLLRIAAIWRGNGVTPTALAPGSYLRPDRKTPGGQAQLPEPDGTVWLANGIYPGWQLGSRLSFEDPREPAPTVAEVGRGPLPDGLGRFKAIRQIHDGVVLEYAAGPVDVSEQLTVVEKNGEWRLARNFHVAPSPRGLWVVLGSSAADVSVALGGAGSPLPSALALEKQTGQGEKPDVWAIHVPPHPAAIEFAAEFSNASSAPSCRG
jgi:hypothetical protein